MHTGIGEALIGACSQTNRTIRRGTRRTRKIQRRHWRFHLRRHLVIVLLPPKHRFHSTLLHLKTGTFTIQNDQKTSSNSLRYLI